MLGGGLLGGALKRASEGCRAGARMPQQLEKHRPQLEAYAAFCDELGEQPADVAPAWLLHQPAVTATIAGPRTRDQLTASQHALDVDLSDDALRRLDEMWPGPAAKRPRPTRGDPDKEPRHDPRSTHHRGLQAPVPPA